ncbi:uncharacterized protein LOC111816063 [Octodon degus]|uniref:Uncharacterized protein LOC111816063 n=1 Tax=Octodon degus TaxID=10160 RepID=A0A6P6E832_OCTDE|nr:uncharacterized protein LOC111816063 [Octodon degus]
MKPSLEKHCFQNPSRTAPAPPSLPNAADFTAARPTERRTHGRGGSSGLLPRAGASWPRCARCAAMTRRTPLPGPGAGWVPYGLPQLPLLVQLALQAARALLRRVRLLLQAADLPAHGLQRAAPRHGEAARGRRLLRSLARDPRRRRRLRPGSHGLRGGAEQPGAGAAGGAGHGAVPGVRGPPEALRMLLAAGHPERNGGCGNAGLAAGDRGREPPRSWDFTPFPTASPTRGPWVAAWLLRATPAGRVPQPRFPRPSPSKASGACGPERGSRVWKSPAHSTPCPQSRTVTATDTKRRLDLLPYSQSHLWTGTLNTDFSVQGAR